MTDADLGPFAPPAKWQPEPELRDDPPRAIPDELRRGPYATKRRSNFKVAVLTAIACIVVGLTGALDRLAYYVLPLGYMTWIGAGILVIAVVVALWPSRFATFRDCVPIVARVLDVVMAVKTTHNGQPSEYHYIALIELCHPKTKELVRRQVASPSIAAVWKDVATTPLRPGQYVTAIYMPGKFEKTLNLYGFLQLTPEADFVQWTSGSGSRFGVAAVVAFIVAFFGALIFAIYAMEFYAPIDTPGSVILESAIGGLAIGIVTTVLFARSARARRERWEVARDEAERESRPIPPAPPQPKAGGHVVLVLFFGLLGWLVVASSLFTANAVLDRSEPTFRPVEIVQFWQTTHEAIIRTYSIEYREQGGPTKKFPATHEHMERFAANAGAIEIRTGALGWPWIRQIHPVKLEVAANGEPVMLAELEDGRVVEIARKRR